MMQVWEFFLLIDRQKDDSITILQLIPSVVQLLEIQCISLNWFEDFNHCRLRVLDYSELLHLPTIFHIIQSISCVDPPCP